MVITAFTYQVRYCCGNLIRDFWFECWPQCRKGLRKHGLVVPTWSMVTTHVVRNPIMWR